MIHQYLTCNGLNYSLKMNFCSELNAYLMHIQMQFFASKRERNFDLEKTHTDMANYRTKL